MFLHGHQTDPGPHFRRGSSLTAALTKVLVQGNIAGGPTDADRSQHAVPRGL